VAPQTPPEDGVYSVRPGDTLERIAARFGVTEQDLLDWNPVRNRHRIEVGQQLRVAAGAVPAAVSPPDVEEHPDALTEFTPPPSGPAEFGETTPPSASSESVADAAAAERAAGGEPADALLADPGDYSVAADGSIEVQAAETLGHYAEWLDVRASRIRSLNKMRYGNALALGQRLRLDLSRVTPQVFEQRRADHHRSLQGAFFERFEIEGTSTHVVRRGDTIWRLAERRFEVPLWLLRQYNPDVDFADLQTGTPLTVPTLRPKEPDPAG
jgi:membrane-bound lytic murein transglycosylase D